MDVRTRPGLTALAGLLLAIPFLAANAVVGNRIEPFFSLIRPGVHTSGREYVLLAVTLALIAAGAVIAARPIFRRSPDGRRHFHPLNAVISAALGIFFMALVVGLGSDIYRCDVLQIPNCD